MASVYRTFITCSNPRDLRRDTSNLRYPPPTVHPGQILRGFEPLEALGTRRKERFWDYAEPGKGIPTPPCTRVTFGARFRDAANNGNCNDDGKDLTTLTSATTDALFGTFFIAAEVR
jgi:hypothetical protein